MCGRFVAATPPARLAQQLQADDKSGDALVPSFNVAPTAIVPVVIERAGGRRLRAMRWGLVPSWARDLSVGGRLTNARAESVADKPAFREAFAHRRCLIPTDGFYEWQRVAGRRPEPFFASRADGRLLVMAGLWEAWRDPEGGDEADWVRTVAVVTTAANSVVGQIHDRMPVVLDPTDWDRWLDPSATGLDPLAELLRPAPDDVIGLRRVSPRVNDARNDEPNLLDPVHDVTDELTDEVPEQGTLALG